MDLTILDDTLEPKHIIDIYESFIWTDRFYQAGDFELHTAMNMEIASTLKLGYYIQNKHSDRVMLIERMLITSDIENGNTINMTGRSLESILDRRIIWGQTNINGNLQNGIKKLLDDCIISPTDPKRRLDNFIFIPSENPLITELTIDAQYMGDNLYDVIQKICEEKQIGFKVILTPDKKFAFSLYVGQNRSYDQNTNPYVIFSPKFDNIIDSNYLETTMTLKNIALVGGEGEGGSRKYATVGDNSGIERRELFVDAKDISSDVGNHKVLTPAEYAAVLVQRGNETLANNSIVKSFEGKIQNDIMFIYDKDFFIGDIVQVANEYGNEAKVLVIEIVISTDESGQLSIYPTYKNVN